MAKHSFIEKIDKKRLCIGCGLCESICGKESVKMQLKKDGFFHPIVKVIKPDQEKIIRKICPGININNDIKFSDSNKTWGKIKGEVYSGYASNPIIRLKSSSGGIISAIATHILKNNLADAILQVGGNKTDYKQNSLKISRTVSDILECASSRYAPALVFDRILEIVDNSNEKYCFIGKPCDISALKNFLRIYPEYKDRFIIKVAIMCAGMPSFNATQKVINKLNATEPVRNVAYRGNGWPGKFTLMDSTQLEYNMDYNDSWGQILGKQIHSRCKICPDGIGIQADIAVGDAWETKDGYPDFEEKEGKSLIVVRTNFGVEMLQSCLEQNDIALKPLDKSNLKSIQPYQYNRRKVAGIRILAYQLAKRIPLHFKHLKLYKNLISVPIIEIKQEFMGSLRRALSTIDNE